MPTVACPPACPSACPAAKKSNDPESKYYREIGTAMGGNQLIIRMEREKGKSKKSGEWSPPCDCDVVEIQRPTSKEGPKILRGPGNNRILFRVQSKTQVGKKEDLGHKPQGIYYEVSFFARLFLCLFGRADGLSSHSSKWSFYRCTSIKVITVRARSGYSDYVRALRCVCAWCAYQTMGLTKDQCHPPMRRTKKGGVTCSG